MDEDKFSKAIPVSPVVKIDIPEYGCTRCKHTWTPRRPIEPTICPKCKCRAYIVKIVQ